MTDILPRLVVVEVHCVCAAPAVNAELRQTVLLDDPVGVLLVRPRNTLQIERSEPDPRLVALLVDLLGYILHSAGEFCLIVIEPVAHEGLVAVVHLEHRDALLYGVKGVEVAQDDILIYLLEVIVP